MEALDHRAFLRGHQAGGHRAGDAQRILHLFGVEPEQLSGRRGCDERTGSALRMETIQEQRHGRCIADAKPDLVTDAQGEGDVPPGNGGIGLGQRHRHRYRQRIGMNDRFLVDVVHLEGVAGRAVCEHGVRQRRAPAASPDRGDRLAAFFADDVVNDPRPGQGRTLQADAEAVDQAQLDAFDDLGWNLLEAGRRGKFRELTRRVRKQGRLRTAHDVSASGHGFIVTSIFLLRWA